MLINKLLGVGSIEYHFGIFTLMFLDRMFFACLMHT